MKYNLTFSLIFTAGMLFACSGGNKVLSDDNAERVPYCKEIMDNFGKHTYKTAGLKYRECYADQDDSFYIENTQSNIYYVQDTLGKDSDSTGCIVKNHDDAHIDTVLTDLKSNNDTLRLIINDNVPRHVN